MRVAATLLIVVAALVAVSLLPIRQTESPPFASPAFQNAFNVDSSAATRAIDLWGSDPLVWRVEPYHGAPDDRRVVQYFERGRMEQDSTSSDVTHGLLARELTMGEIDLGDDVSLERQSPEIAIDSLDVDDQVPTYLTLSRLVGESARDRSGAGRRVVDWVDRGGVFERDFTPAVVRHEEYVPESGHNLPDVTVELFDRPEFAEERWVEAFGYPITEPYWTYYRRGEDLTQSMIQVFERRVLVYTPDMEPDERFTLASSGRHYYEWRYGADLTPTVVEGAEPEEAAGIATPDGFMATTYARDIGTPIGLTLSPAGHPMVLTQEGRILKPVTRDPDRAPEEFMVWAEGIEAPLGIGTSGESVVVTTADGSQWYRERDGVGVLQETVSYESGFTPGEASVDHPAVDPEGSIVAGGEDPGTIVPSGELKLEPGDLPGRNGFTPSGPRTHSGFNLYIAGKDANDRASVAVVPAEVDNMSAEDLTILASFPPGTSPTAMAVAHGEAGPAGEFGRLFLAVEDGEESRIHALPAVRSSDERASAEFAGGLDRPTALLFGLDGSLYIADADRGEVIRIQRDD